MGKVKNGKPIHLESICTGKVLHSNMAEGGMCSWGGREHTELGWELHGEHKRIKNGGQVALRGLGNSEERAFMHSNAEEGGGFSFGGEQFEHGWTLQKVPGESSESKWLKWGDTVYMVSNHGKGYWHSNSEEGAGFSWGDERPDLAWRVVKCQDDSDSSDSDCDEDGWPAGKVKNGKAIHLQSVCNGSVLHSNMGEGGMCSWGGPEHTELGWELHGEHKRIKNGGQVALRGLGNSEERAFMHSNAEEGGGFSFGGEEIEHGWTLQKVPGESSRGKWLRWGDTVYMISNHGKGHWHSNSEEGGPFSWGDERPDLAWKVLKCEDDSDCQWSWSDCDED